MSVNNCVGARLYTSYRVKVYCGGKNLAVIVVGVIAANFGSAG